MAPVDDLDEQERMALSYPTVAQAAATELFTPYIFTKSQIADIFAACDASRLYDVRMGTSLFSMPALLRMLYGTVSASLKPRP